MGALQFRDSIGGVAVIGTLISNFNNPDIVVHPTAVAAATGMGGTGYAGYDFSTTKSIVEVSFKGGDASYGLSCTPYAFWVEWSDDGILWNGHTYTTPEWTLGEIRAFILRTEIVYPSPTKQSLLPQNLGRKPILTKPLSALSTLIAPTTGRLKLTKPSQNVVTNLWVPAQGRMQNDSGFGTISGILTVLSIPRARKVRLFNAITGNMVRETWSNLQGQYSFPQMDMRHEYFVVGFDHQELYNASIQDLIIPAL